MARQISLIIKIYYINNSLAVCVPMAKPSSTETQAVVLRGLGAGPRPHWQQAERWPRSPLLKLAALGPGEGSHISVLN